MLGIGVFGVADRAFGLGNGVRDPVIALGADAGPPLTAVSAPTFVRQSGLTLLR